MKSPRSHLPSRERSTTSDGHPCHKSRMRKRDRKLRQGGIQVRLMMPASIGPSRGFSVSVNKNARKRLWNFLESVFPWREHSTKEVKYWNEFKILIDMISS